MISEPGYSPEQPGEALGAFGGGGFPPDGGAGGAALLRDPLIGPTGPPMEHHPGMLLQSGYRQYDQVLLNAGYQPPPPPPAAGAVAVPAAQSYMRDLAVETAAQSAQMGAAAVAGRVSLGLVARAMAQSAPALAGVPLYAGALQGVAQAALTVASASAGAVVRNTFNRKPPPGAGAAAVAALPGGLGVAEVRQMFEPAQRTPIERQFVAKGVPRDGAAVLAMQKKHDLSGGSAPQRRLCAHGPCVKAPRKHSPVCDAEATHGDGHGLCTEAERHKKRRGQHCHVHQCGLGRPPTPSTARRGQDTAHPKCACTAVSARHALWPDLGGAPVGRTCV